MFVIIVVPDWTFFSVTSNKALASRLFTSFRKNFLLLLSISPITHRIFTSRSPLHFLLRNALSSITTVWPTPPIFVLFCDKNIVNIFRNSEINFLVLFVFNSVSFVIIEIGYLKIHANKTHYTGSVGFRPMPRNVLSRSQILFWSTLVCPAPVYHIFIKTFVEIHFTPHFKHSILLRVMFQSVIHFLIPLSLT